MVPKAVPKGCIINTGPARRSEETAVGRGYISENIQTDKPHGRGARGLGEIAFSYVNSACTGARNNQHANRAATSSNADRSANLDHLAGAALVGSLTTWRFTRVLFEGVAEDAPFVHCHSRDTG